MLADLSFKEKEKVVLDILMLELAAKTLAQIQGIDANIVFERLAFLSKQKLKLMSPEMIEKTIAAIDTERMANSESIYTPIIFLAVQEDGST
ncbi:hypothetical protein [Okeania sp. SIO2B3]|uniref:hypothetical protein n=1 Tax=Okeania sp. SIO2B3 TaxID=2607784 RepID=UPI0013BEF020|nr:hypothetical protein [Okeania sp. SIO2B3]NET46738.1 hypothetical protein [Okeania sp. SIO2B3]